MLKSCGYAFAVGFEYQRAACDAFRRQFASTIDLFDHLILSYEVGCMKPDARFYQAAVAAAGVPAESCVFIDDLPENVEELAKRA